MRAQETVQRLLDDEGSTLAARAGINLENKPAPLYRLLVLVTLLSARIKADLAVSAARELAEFGTAQKMCDATWQQRVDALDRGHYVRYDESTSTALGKGAQLLIDRYHGDLRRMRAKADGDLDVLRELLTEVPRIGPVGADVFCREVQLVWPEIRPFFDEKALAGARKLGLRADADALAELVEGHDLARLATALAMTS
ncbi:endonuclease [Saccharopolyspora sp. WRP15-2]|uniref:Endonuclease n=1 Tax=Saccharopolyspora oryzae TaxID=2997343 RepID=A0ABT4VAC4_9PSEU|nr:endonuclease [Saccharopolyspora oryzae]MDA3630922.1 endonuclease [Saccharopolyspora oryzae]